MGMVERAGWRWASGEGDRRRHAARRQRQRRCHRASTEAAGRRKIEAVAIEEMVGVELVGITRVCPLTENQQKFGQRHIEQGRVYWLRDEQAIDAGKIETLPLSKRLQSSGEG